MDCETTVFSLHVLVKCSYHTSSSATGFQVIVQSHNFNELYKIYSNKTVDFNTPVTVTVDENGTYLVTVYAISGQMGILDSSEEYEEMVLLSGRVQGTK